MRMQRYTYFANWCSGALQLNTRGFGLLMANNGMQWILDNNTGGLKAHTQPRVIAFMFVFNLLLST